MTRPKITVWRHMYYTYNVDYLTWRKSVGVDGTVAYEMYATWRDSKDSDTKHPFRAGGGTFNLSMFSDEQVEHALDEFHRDKRKIRRDNLAILLFVCNVSMFGDIESFECGYQADNYICDLKCTSPWG